MVPIGSWYPTKLKNVIGEAVNQQTKNHSIYWFSWQPTPYNDVLFRFLYSIKRLNMKVIYRNRVVASHPWKEPLGQGYPNDYYRPFLGVDWKSLGLISRRHVKIYVIAGWDHPTTIILLSLLRLFQRRYLIWTDTPNQRVRQSSGTFELARKIWLNWILNGSRTMFSTGEVGVNAFRTFKLRNQKIFNLPFVLDLTKYPSSDSLAYKYKERQILKFVSSGRIQNSIKGHDIAIRALVDALGIQNNWKYVIAGTGPDLNLLQSLAKSLGVSANIHFVGWIEPVDLISLLSESHVLLHPSPIHDPYPNAVLEGMAAACVVMASDACGSAVDRIESGKNGLIHSAGDRDQLANQIRHLVTSGDMDKLGSAARKTADYWTPERSTESLIYTIKHELECAV